MRFVIAMSKALMNRFSSYHIEYEKQTFIDYIKDTWDKNVVEFLKGSQWAYMSPDKLGKKDGKEDVYISPRTWHKISDAELALMRDDRDLHRITVTEELGADVGSLYHAFCFDESPVCADDILKDEKEGGAVFPKNPRTPNPLPPIVAVSSWMSLAASTSVLGVKYPGPLISFAVTVSPIA